MSACPEVGLLPMKGEASMYYGEFDSKADICKEFQIGHFDGEVLFAQYEYLDYDGSAVVLFAHDGKLWFVEGGHCSCYGLEDQWEPEEMTVPMMQRIVKGETPTGFSSYGFGKSACIEVLRVLDDLNLVGAPDDVVAVALKLRYG
jgi:hypothetical protein